MAKGGGRKTSEKDKSRARDSGVAAALSPDDAERAAAMFVPVWQLDDAPFSAGAQVSDLDLRLLGSPPSAPVELQHAPPTILGAARHADGDSPLDASLGAATIRISSPSETAPVEPLVSSAESVDPELGSRATIRMTPATLHQPVPERQKQPSLPSVIVEESEAALPLAVVTEPVSATIDPPAPIEQEAGQGPVSARLREPKTDPPAARARSATTITSRRDRPAPAPYEPARRRNPIVLGSVLMGLLAVGVTAYVFASGSRDSGPATPTNGSQAMAPTHAVPPEPSVFIPPPPPPADMPPPASPDDTHTAAAAPAVVPPPAQALPPSYPLDPSPPLVQAPVAPPPRTANPRTTVAAAPSTQAPRGASNPSGGARPPSSKNAPPPPAGGGIVRDNPF